MQIYAYTLSNEHITFHVNPETGTIGTGLDTSAQGLVYDGTEYLNKIGIPFEFFSLKIDGVVYANDNSEGYKGTWPPSGLRSNTKNILTVVQNNGKTIEAVTTLPGIFRITHKYKLGQSENHFQQKQGSKNLQKNISVDVKVENLSSSSVSMKYARGIDMDPPNINTINRMGYREGDKKIPKENLVYTVSKKPFGKYPLSFFSKHDLTHRGAILAFDKFKGCLYDPDKIVENSVDPYTGDGVIYMVFDLGILPSEDIKTFSWSYYLDDDLEKVADEIYSKDPKLEVQPSSISYTLKHHEKNEKKNADSENEKVVLHPTNQKFLDDGSKHTVTIQLKEGERLPEGVNLVVGDTKQTISNTNRKVILPTQYTYDEKIVIQVLFDRKWREKTTKKVAFKIGTSNEEGSYDLLTVKFIPEKDDTLFLSSDSETLNYTVPYGETRRYESLHTKQFTIQSKANKGIKHKALLTLENESMPKGLILKINGVALDDSFTYNIGVPLSLTLYRNNSYKEEKENNINLIFRDEQLKQDILIPVQFTPSARTLQIDVKPLNPSARLDELKISDELEVTLYANGKKIESDSFSAYELKADCKGVKCNLRKDKEAKKFFLKVKPKFILGLTRTGNIPIKIQLIEGVYPGDSAENTFTYTVEDIGWKKWIEPFKWLVLLLILLWYLWGITGGKKRFKKNQVVRYAPIKRGEVQRKNEMDYHLRKKLPWWDALIPYRAQRYRVANLKFKAVRNRQIYLDKKSQALVDYNGLKIENEGQKDLKLFPGDTLRTNHELYTIQ
jgi:hypothetical protein